MISPNWKSCLIIPSRVEIYLNQVSKEVLTNKTKILKHFKH